MEKLLAKLVKNDEEIKAELKVQSNLLQQLYQIDEKQLAQQKKEAKAASDRAKTEKQRDKVGKSDRGGMLTKMFGSKDKEVKKKGILQTILGPLMAGAGATIALKAGLVALAGVAGIAIERYINSPEFRNTINKNIIEPLGNILGTLFNTFKESLSKGLKKADDQIGNFTRNTVTGSQTSKTTQNVQERKRTIDLAQEKFKPEDKSPEAEAARKALLLSRDLEQQSLLIDQRDAAILRSRDEIARLEKDPGVDPMTGKKNLTPSQIKEKTGKDSAEEMAIRKHQKDKQKAQEKMMELQRQLTELGYQSGGFVGRVPNQGGNGDRFRTMLESGSVVLNQTASGYQNGGMIPVMLEQGERVFGPRDPMAGAALAMNALIPRFQEGGVVESKGVADTGAGYQPKGQKDYSGRPLILSEKAAEAWAKIMNMSGGAVKGSDVTSAQRSVIKNNQENGAPNSNHLYGNAVDVDYTSPTYAWMKENDGAGGWFWNNYSPAAPWHFDYKGAGAMTQYPGTEKGVGKEIEKENAKLGLAQFDLFGMLRSLITGATQMAGSLFDMVGGGGLDLSSGFVGSTGPATPLTGDTAAKAEEMFNYIVEKGYTAAQAKGIVANIQRESNFDPKVRSGDDGGPGGLFQWKGSRQTATVGKLVNSGDWKGQIDYALQEDAGPRYKSETAGMNAHDASMWWAKYWERPASLTNANSKHSQFLKSYGFQEGGVANVSGKGSTYAGTSQMVQKTQEQFAQEIAKAVTPVVIPMPVGGGGGGQATTAASATPFPSMSSEDSSIMAMEYKYRITMGASV